MKLLAHISDVHFGREDPDLVTGLLHALPRRPPRRHRRLRRPYPARPQVAVPQSSRLPSRTPRCPRLVVPGNHDVSATNLYDRLARPLKRYRRYIASDLSPFLEDPGYAISGINTVRLLARKDGRINRSQVQCTCNQLARAQPEAVRIVVTHHPMDLPMDDKKHALVARSNMAMRAFSACGVDLFLSGHLHAGQTVVTSTRYGMLATLDQPHAAAVVAQAGTAVSTRTRGEANAWNLIRLNGRAPGATMIVEQRVWNLETKQFIQDASSTFTRTAQGWTSPHP